MATTRPTAVELKRFFKHRYGIAVRASAGKRERHFSRVSIPSIPRPISEIHEPTRYGAEFPVQLRQHCLQIIYPNSPSLHQQASAGNVERYSIAMHPNEWRKLFAQYGEPIGEPETAAAQ